MSKQNFKICPYLSIEGEELTVVVNVIGLTKFDACALNTIFSEIDYPLIFG